MPIAHKSAEVKLRDSRDGSPGPGITSGHACTASYSGVGAARTALKKIKDRTTDEKIFAVNILKLGLVTGESYVSMQDKS